MEGHLFSYISSQTQSACNVYFIYDAFSHVNTVYSSHILSEIPNVTLPAAQPTASKH